LKSADYVDAIKKDT